MSDIFINTEIQKPPKPYNNNNCPPGQYISLKAKGKNNIAYNGLRIYEVRLNEISNYKQMLVGVSCIYAVSSSTE